MDQTQLATLVDRLTGRLVPAFGSTRAQLDQLKRELARALRWQPLEEFTAGGLGLPELIDPEPEAGRAAAGEPSPESMDIANAVFGIPFQAGHERMAFRRDVPAVTSGRAASTPLWAAGQRIDRTLGPFTDHTGKTYWFDFFSALPFTRILRGTDLILLVPLPDGLAPEDAYALAAGTVWIKSRLLTPTAPAGAFTALRIHEGRIAFVPAATAAGGMFVLGTGDECELLLALDPPVHAHAVDTATGDDAEGAAAQPPGHVRIVVRPSRATIVEAGEMRARMFGRNYHFRMNGQPPVFEPLLNRVLVPFDGTESSVSAPTVASALFRISGKAEAMANAWALPVTVTSADRLGAAAGVGAIVIRAGPGLRAVWEGLDRGPVRLESSYLLTEPGRIAVITTAAISTRSLQRYELWQERNHDRLVRSAADVRYPSRFRLHYESWSSGSETLMIGGVSLGLRIDRPLSAAGHRPRVEVPRGEVTMFEVKGQRAVYVHGQGILQQLLDDKRVDELRPCSLALTNAFVNVSAVDRVDIAGHWTARREVDAGVLLLFARVHYLLPTLPDPYVTSYSPVFSERRLGGRPGEGATATFSTGVHFASVVFWAGPVAPGLLFAFVRADQADTTPVLPEPARERPDVGERQYSSFAAVHNRAAAIREEDAANTRGLRLAFEEALHSGREGLALDVAGHILLLDVSTNADLFGIGLRTPGPRVREDRRPFPFAVIGMDLVTAAVRTRVCTLPQIQWEAVRTIQNPAVRPYPFPSPIGFIDTGDPTVIATESYALVPIAPRPVIHHMVEAFNRGTPSTRLAALFSLPFGMKAAAGFAHAEDATRPGARVSLNCPEFPDERVDGGIQISVVATSPFVGPKAESPGFPGATIQTRNLVDLITGTIPLDDEGKPLSVLGPVVDTVFNREFKPGGARPRVPLRRIDVSGYGATIFSDWLNPTAQIAATSQARFDVLIGRTAHEIVQIKSLLYPWAVPVVRTITIQRTPGGGVTRADSGWTAQGPGEYDFSYYEYDEVTDTTTLHPSPFEMHPGAVPGVYNVTRIRDTGRIHRQPHADPLQTVEMQEVFFDCDVRIEDVRAGGVAGLVPSKGQRGFVQLAPYQKPLKPEQFFRLLQEEGSLGGCVECVISIGNSGHPMSVARVDVNGVAASTGPLFVTAARGAVHLPQEGSWSVVRRGGGGASAVGPVPDETGVPLVREGKLGVPTVKPYRLADPADLLNEVTPATDYGLLHSTASEKTLYLRPTIARDAATIESALRPHFADSYSLLNAKGIFPDIDTVFQLGPGGTSLQILGNGRLRLNTAATQTVAPGVTRDLMSTGGARIYVDYAERPAGATSQLAVTFDSAAPVPWTATVARHSLVMDLAGFSRILSVSVDHVSRFGERPRLVNPKVDLGPPLGPVVDVLRFLGGFEMAEAFGVTMGNAISNTWQPKWKAGVQGLEVEFRAGGIPVLEVKALGLPIVKASEQLKFEAKLVTPLPPLTIKLEMSLGFHYNMLPFSHTGRQEGSNAALEKADKLSIGGFFEFEGQLNILCFAISQNTGAYFIGILGFEIELDNKDGMVVTYKIAVGMELVTRWPVVGDVALQSGLGIEYETSTKGSSAWSVLGFFKGEAELLEGLVVIAISVEAKGGQESETENGVKKTFAVMVVEFAAEVSLAFVINIEFSVTWEEKKQLA